MPMFSAAIFRTRYETVMHSIHFRDHTLCRPWGDPDYDHLQKIQLLIDYLSQKFTDLYTLSLPKSL